MSKNVTENMAEEMEVVAPSTELAEVRTNPLEVMSVEDFTNPSASMMYCSIKSEGDMKSKAAIFNAINSPEEKIAEHINKPIMLKDIVAHPIRLVDEKTGEVLDAMRMVLVDENGVGYEAVSSGIVNAVSRILQIFGQPETWDGPIKIIPIQKKTRNGDNKVTTLKIDM